MVESRDWKTSSEAVKIEEMDKYLEDDEILNILEQRESGSWSASFDDRESDHLSVEELSSSKVSNTDDDSQNLNASSTCLISRNKKENWSSTPCTSNTGRTAACNIFRERTGPSRYAKSQCESESDSFKLFFRNTLLDKFRDWTNAEGLLVYKENWTAIDQSEFDKFLGVVIFIGVYKSNSENFAQLWSKEDGRPIFNKLMSRNRYQQILRVLRFDMQMHGEATDQQTNFSLLDMFSKNEISICGMLTLQDPT